MEDIIDVTPVEVKKEPPKCDRHPDELLPCPICAKLEAEGKALAAIRREMRGKRRYFRQRGMFDKAALELQDRLRKQGIYKDARTARINAQREKRNG